MSDEIGLATMSFGKPTCILLTSTAFETKYDWGVKIDGVRILRAVDADFYAAEQHRVSAKLPPLRWLGWLALLFALVFGSAAANAQFADYKVGPGDVLTISVYRSADLQAVTRVSGAGTITLATLGEITVAELSPSEIAARIATLLKERGVLVAPSVNVLVTEYHSKVVSVLGAVARPGEIVLDRPGLSLAEILARAGASFTTGGGIITIKAADGASRQLRVSDLISSSSAQAVSPGDSIFVQLAPSFFISGQVQKAGAYPLEPSLTVGQAVALGGGLTPRGSMSKVSITRTGPDGVARTMKSLEPSTPVLAGDLISVGARLF